MLLCVMGGAIKQEGRCQWNAAITIYYVKLLTETCVLDVDRDVPLIPFIDLKERGRIFDWLLTLNMLSADK